ncbi:tetrachloroethene dehalogenase [uncultured Shewanella sp.]|uniref:tetrachloroethene dehalogenase n=1 Tax=Shewanella atlantica TaxID=271099 RepID=UPI00262CD0FD|nr:tetrachloroethene dehalogenase [uncultured Shewanella sp.]
MMGLQWYLMGALTIFAWNGYLWLGRHYRLDWKASLGLFISACTLLVCFGWSWASFAEGEARSGAMGLLIFGLGGLLIFSGTWRAFIKPKNCSLN